MPTSVSTVLDDLAGACPRVMAAEPGDHVDGVPARFVAYPTSNSEVSAVLTVATSHDLRVVTRGRGTKSTWGRPPHGVDLIVDLSAMDRVLDHAAGDLVVVVQAGTALTDVQRSVASARQRLAVDGGVAGASIGGTIATATSGPRRAVVGTVRDLLIGVSLVRVDGTVAKAGGRVVKNVAGYDLCKLVTGSYGTLAVITEAIFRLHPMATDARYLTVTTDDRTALAAAAHSVIGSQVVASGVEIDWPADGPGAVGVLLEGTVAGVENRTAATAAMMTGFAVKTLLAPDWWGAYPWAGADDGHRATALKVTFRIGALGEVLRAARALEVPLHLRGSAAVGVVYGAIPSGTDPQAVARAVQRLREVAASNGGSVVVLDAAAEVKAVVDSWGPIPALDLMRRVKAQFDPTGRLAPGRFVGGI